MIYCIRYPRHQSSLALHSARNRKNEATIFIHSDTIVALHPRYLLTEMPQATTVLLTDEGLEQPTFIFHSSDDIFIMKNSRVSVYTSKSDNMGEHFSENFV